MRTLIWSNAFTRSFKGWMHKRPDLHNDVAEVLRLLVVNPFAPQLETHKLKGKLSGSWACSAGYDLRIVFDFVKAEKGSADDILLLAIGTHDEVY
ncbi:MAG: type II toxin-antitoxin system mRNA interferase toxin, RelE/StbE family [Deltaproteobacteria bacterium]|nr:type II toxin-antitoxin system mRNA interferase toxin, RelE/StbE family [Deltaproteobacteria bacterium]MBW2034950.1 type II toxin-antitoxin system mRNA interferase toxin, RelE/StbE family [Deltaproteobacteria bacterium]MBW2115327.1 type II toxin-antitoxin system mRNA interferase toxin, RelE/StbE family [Deltaproteobacteria bacterium]MBW2169615.1 type II toxin-antitoxin system mRNA interferase toxin, RelE/StbE family [Deltaproteobacteria bacterium]